MGLPQEIGRYIEAIEAKHPGVAAYLKQEQKAVQSMVDRELIPSELPTQVPTAVPVEEASVEHLSTAMTEEQAPLFPWVGSRGGYTEFDW